MPLLGEAMRAYEQGVGTAEDIDTGARIGLNHPMGPLALADFIGLDVVLGIMRVLHEGFGEPQFAPPAVLERLVAEGHLGQKSGRGFHDVPALRRAAPEGRQPDEVPDERGELVEVRERLRDDREPVGAARTSARPPSPGSPDMRTNRPRRAGSAAIASVYSSRPVIVPR